MSKLTEIQQRATETMVNTRNNSWSVLDDLLNDVFYLIRQVEEKDKALNEAVEILKNIQDLIHLVQTDVEINSPASNTANLITRSIIVTLQRIKGDKENE